MISGSLPTSNQYLPPVRATVPSSSARADAGPSGTGASSRAGAVAKDESLESSPSRRVRAPVGSSEQSQTGQRLSDEELQMLSKLKARDREVRAHEAAHKAVGGRYTGAISYTFQRGPDGAQYAVGGQVSIDTAPVSGDPQATIDKMRTVRAAALAPAQPSPQDRSVAAEATQELLKAQTELATERREERLGDAREEGSASPLGDDPAGLDGRQQAAASTYQTVSAFGESASVRPSQDGGFRASA